MLIALTRILPGAKYLSQIAAIDGILTLSKRVESSRSALVLSCEAFNRPEQKV